MNEEILIDIKIQKGDNDQKVTQLTQRIEELKKETADLVKANRDLAKQGKENSQEYIENARQIEINKQKINENSASRKNLIQVIRSEDNSIKALQVRNAELIKQRNLINTSTEEGRRAIQEINAEINKNNEVIRENSSELEQQKINIGNYASALDGVIPGFSRLVAGFESANVAAKSLWVTLGPIVIALAAVAAAIAPVVSFLKNTGDGADLVEKKMEGLNNALRVAQDQFNEVGRKIVEGEGVLGKFSQGVVKLVENFTFVGVAIQAFTKLFPDLTAELKAAAEAGEQYAEALDEIGTAQQFFQITAKDEENQIKQLIIQSKNRTLSEKERIEKIDEALSKEGNLAIKRKTFADDELSATLRLAKSLKSLSEFFSENGKQAQKAEEDQVKFAERVAKALDKTDEKLRDKLVQSILAVKEAEAGNIAIVEKLQNQRDALLDKQEEADAKRREEEFARSEEERLARIAALERQFEVEEEITLSNIGEDGTITNIYKNFNKRLEQDAKKRADAEKRSRDESIKNDRMAQAERDKLRQQALDTATVFFEGEQEIQSGLALVSTYFAAQKAYESQMLIKSPDAPFRAALAATLATIQGLARVAAINGVKFEQGGIARTGGVLSGPAHAQGGIKFTVGGRPGFEAEGNEIILTKGVHKDPVLRQIASNLNVAGGGVPFATGGIIGNETRVAAVSASSAFDINQLANLVNSVQPVLILEDFERKATTVTNNRNKAVVIS